MDAKGELLENLKQGAKAVLNGDDPRVLRIAGKTSNKVLFFGFSENAVIRARSLKKKGVGISFSLKMPEESIPVDLKAPGTFMVYNALAAASVGYLLGLPAKEIKAGLEGFRQAAGRMNIFKTNKGIHIIDDTYNANPASMEAAISTFKSLRGESRGIMVAGDMLELGRYAEQMHKKIGSTFARSNISKLYGVGEFAEAVASGAMEEDMDQKDIVTGNIKEVLESLKTRLRPGDWVLVKGSRGMHMERIVEGLKTAG